MKKFEPDNRDVPTIAVFGLGYVGCVTAACFAALGYRVRGVDVDVRKVQAIQDGQSPFYEPGLDVLLRENLTTGRLTATCSTEEALECADIAFVCVGTPSSGNGNLNVEQLHRVCADIAEHMSERMRPLTVVIRSTVFPGTCDQVVAPVFHKWAKVTVVANPEFLREGSAVNDFMKPSLLVVGSHDSDAARNIAALYSALEVEARIVKLRTAELIKYACNAFHALKIAFANEMGTLATLLELDAEEVMETVCKDHKLNISAAYLRPGFAFGGSCLPKDLRAMNYRARQLDIELPLLKSVLLSNEAHILRAFRQIMDTGFTRIGIYGLAFKPNTDDLRESPAVALVEMLIGKGRDIKVYDPHIELDALYGSNRAFLFRTLPHIGRCMEKQLDLLLEWADIFVATIEPSKETLEKLTASGIPIINLVRNTTPMLAQVAVP